MTSIRIRAHRRSAFLVLIGLSFAWGIAVATRLLYHGEILGLDFGLFHPDGACYAVFAFELAGMQASVGPQVAAVYTDLGHPIGDALSDDSGACNGSGLRGRVLYPLLSVPFVRILGLDGMLVIPALCWLWTVLVPASMLVRRGHLLGALIAGALAISSGTIGRWGVSNTLDPLLMALVATTLLFLPIYQPMRRVNLWVLGSLAFAGSFTRLSFPIWIGIAFGPWAYSFIQLKASSSLRYRIMNPWAGAFGVMSLASLVGWQFSSRWLGAQNPSVFVSTLEQGLQRALADSASESNAAIGEPQLAQNAAIEDSPVSAESALLQFAELVVSTLQTAVVKGLNVVFVEFGQLAVLDRSLLLLLALAALGSWHLRRQAYSVLFPTNLITVLIIGGLNGTIGVNFRFQLSVLPFAILMAGALVPRSYRGGTWSKLHVKPTRDVVDDKPPLAHHDGC